MSFGSSPSRALRFRAALLFCLFTLLLLPSAALGEAQIVVKGDTLRGRVAELTADGVVFEPTYGAGSIEIPWADIERLETENSIELMYGDDGEASGRILGVRDGQVILGSSDGTTQSVDTSEIFYSQPDDFSESVMDRLRSRFRHWTAALGAGIAYTESTTDKASGSLDLRMLREEGPTRLLLEGGFRYANEKDKGEDRSVTENRLYGLARGEYDVTERFYSYLSTRATHDADLDLALRLEPRGGAGYHVVKSPDLNFSTDVGLAWVYEDYYGDDFIEGAFPLERSRGNENHWAIAFGARANAKLPYGALWRASAEYLPAVDDWADDYLARFETAVDFPLLEWLAFTAALRDEYDNTPAKGKERNTLTTTAGLSFRFP
jgi:hypothetical protein